MITRQDYINKKATHEDYYSQFVDDSVLDTVKSFIGESVIKNSTDKHFNDIPLKEWDSLKPFILSSTGKSLAKANGRGGVSLSDCVCVAKQAARIIKEGLV